MKLRRIRRASGSAAAHHSRYGPRRAPRITAAQRDAIYRQILDSLSSASDLSLLATQGDLGAVRRLAREVADDLQLVLDVLGWGETSSGAEVELDLPVEQLRRTFARLRERAVEEEQAAKRREDFAQELVETQAPDERSLIVIETCDQVLSGLAEGRQ
jgi:hypothetical protein